MGNLLCTSKRALGTFSAKTEKQIVTDFKSYTDTVPTPETMSDIITQFSTWETCYNWQTYLGNVPKKLVEKYKVSIKQRMIKQHEHAQNTLSIYNIALDKILAAKVYLSAIEIEKEFDEAKRTLKTKNIYLTTLNYIGLNVIRKQFEEKNLAAYKIERQIQADATTKILQYYKNAMTTFTSSIQYCPELYLKGHYSIMMALTNKIDTIFKDELRIETTKEIWDTLDVAFAQMHESTMLKLQEKYNMMTKVICESRSQYEHLMNTYITRNNGSISENVFNEMHRKNQELSITNLESLITTRMGQHEPVHLHINTLRRKIRKSYKSLHRTVFGRGRRRMASDTDSNYSTSDDGVGNDLSRISEAIEDITTDGGPIFYRVSLLHIFSGVLRDKDAVMSSSTVQESDIIFGEKTPTEVALCQINGDYKWVCGSELSSLPRNCTIVKSWQLKNCFQTTGLWRDDVTINEVNVKVTLPFLLAVILKRTMTVDQSSTAMISVPAWFSSFLRKQIIEAAEIAGFQIIKLFNENTALAFKTFCDTPKPFQRVFVSENSGKVDISMYTCQNDVSSLKLKNHMGDIEVSNLDTPSHIKELLQVFPSVKKLRGINLVKSITERFNLDSLVPFLPSGKLEVRILNDTRNDILKNYGKNFAGSKVKTISKKDVLLGLASIYHYCEKYSESISILQEKSQYDILVHEGNPQTCCAKSAEVTNSNIVGITEYVCDLKNFKAGDYNFAENGTRFGPLGTLTVNNDINNSESNGTMRVTVERGPQGTINLRKVEIVPNYKTAVGRPMRRGLYSWRNFLPEEEQIDWYKNLLINPVTLINS